MNQKMMIAGILCALVLCTAAFAANPKDGAETSAADSASVPAASSAAVDTVPTADPIDAPAEMPAETIPYSIGVKAVVTEILRDGDNISLEVKPEDGEPIVLTISEKTLLVDNSQAVPVSIEDIKAGDTIYAYHDIMMTMSIPAQTPALVILTNLGDGAPAVLHMPEQVRVADGKASALCDDGSIWLSTSEDTVFLPYRTKQLVRAEDIQIGQPFLAWYDIVMESYPAQATANRIMIPLPDYDERELTMLIDGDMSIDAKMVNGEPVVPVRVTAEALGLKVGYRKENGKGLVTVSSSEAELSMTLGEDAYSMKTLIPGAVGATAAIPYGIEPHLAPYMDGPDVTWISAEAFQLLGYDVTLRHNQLTITKE